jgi:hypothetical protein
MFVNARIINKKENKNPSQIIIDTFAVIFFSISKISIVCDYTILLTKYCFTKSLYNKNISLLNLKQIITNSLK